MKQSDKVDLGWLLPYFNLLLEQKGCIPIRQNQAANDDMEMASSRYLVGVEDLLEDVHV